MSIAMSDLKPCPFCGCDAYHHQVGNSSTKRRGYIVGCEKCGFHLSVNVVKNSLEWAQEKVAEKWNTRSIDATNFSVNLSKHFGQR